jgi:ribosomal protein L17
MLDNTDHSSPTSNEFKLMLDNAMLEMEKRFTKTLTETLATQDSKYMDKLVTLTKETAILASRQDLHEQNVKNNFKTFKASVTAIVGAATTLSGLVGFFIGQLHIGGK